MSHEQRDLVAVFDTSDPGLLPVVKSILLGADIDFLVQGEEAMNLYPIEGGLGPFKKGGISARVMVRPEDAEAVKELLTELK